MVRRSNRHGVKGVGQQDELLQLVQWDARDPGWYVDGGALDILVVVFGGEKSCWVRQGKGLVLVGTNAWVACLAVAGGFGTPGGLGLCG